MRLCLVLFVLMLAVTPAHARGETAWAAAVHFAGDLDTIGAAAMGAEFNELSAISAGRNLQLILQLDPAGNQNTVSRLLTRKGLINRPTPGRINSGDSNLVTLQMKELAGLSSSSRALIFCGRSAGGYLVDHSTGDSLSAAELTRGLAGHSTDLDILFLFSDDAARVETVFELAGTARHLVLAGPVVPGWGLDWNTALGGLTKNLSAPGLADRFLKSLPAGRDATLANITRNIKELKKQGLKDQANRLKQVLNNLKEQRFFLVRVQTSKLSALAKAAALFVETMKNRPPVAHKLLSSLRRDLTIASAPGRVDLAAFAEAAASRLAPHDPAATAAARALAEAVRSAVPATSATHDNVSDIRLLVAFPTTDAELSVMRASSFHRLTGWADLCAQLLGQ